MPELRHNTKSFCAIDMQPLFSVPHETQMVSCNRVSRAGDGGCKSISPPQLL